MVGRYKARYLDTKTKSTSDYWSMCRQTMLLL